jgi:hypothetical protein
MCGMAEAIDRPDRRLCATQLSDRGAEPSCPGMSLTYVSST